MDYMAKVKALLDRAQHPKTPPAEAEAAMTKAAELMARHGIDEAQVRQREGREPEEIDIMVIELPGNHSTVIMEAVYPMIKAMGADAIVTGDNLTMVGTESMLTNFRLLFAVMEVQMVSAANERGDAYAAKLHREHPRWTDEQIDDATDKWVWDYIRAYGRAVGKKIQVRLGEVADESPGNALVLKTEAQRVHDEFNKRFPNRHTMRGQRQTSVDAMTAGTADGRNAYIGDAPVGGQVGARAIGR